MDQDQYRLPFSQQEIAAISCKGCYRINTHKERHDNFGVCVFCGHHNYLPVKERIEQLLDENSWSEYNADLSPTDRLGFSDTKPYTDRIADSIKRTGQNSAVVTGEGTIGDIKLQLVILNFKFMGGSLGSVEGEKITQAIERAMANRTGVVIVSASGGARMQESSYSLFQMAKTAAALKRLSEKGLPYVSILTNPTAGGVSASFAFLGDVIIAEPKAVIGFAGRRVIEQTIKAKLPDNFQIAEFLLERGLIDAIITRQEMRSYLIKVLQMFSSHSSDSIDHATVEFDPTQYTPDQTENLTPMEILKLARHPQRPYAMDYIQAMLDQNSTFELRGDRHFSNDQSMVTFFGRIDGKKVLIIGEEKGRELEDKQKRNFGMVHPEGFRKALRMAKLAEKFKIPIVSLVDTPGAYPGVGAEERGQSEAIAYNLYEFSGIKVPIIAIVIGEGGSGGALAIAAANSLAILQYGVFSVISPEGCAAILWSDKSKTATALENLKMLASDLYQHKIVDHVISEPNGGAQLDHPKIASSVRRYILEQMAGYHGMSGDEIVVHRDKKIRNIGTGQ